MTDIGLLRNADETWSTFPHTVGQRASARSLIESDHGAIISEGADILHYEAIEIMGASLRFHRQLKRPAKFAKTKWLVPLIASVLIAAFGVRLGLEGRVIWVLPLLMASFYLLLFALSQRVSERLGES